SSTCTSSTWRATTPTASSACATASWSSTAPRTRPPTRSSRRSTGARSSRRTCAVPEASSLPRPPAAGRIKAALTVALFAALFVLAFRQTGFNFQALFSGTADFFRFFGRLVPDWSALPQIWPPLIQTIQIAYVATIVGSLLAMPIVFLASSNTSTDPVTLWIARTLLTVLRSIPDLLWAALFVAVLGLGALPGVVALVFF